MNLHENKDVFLELIQATAQRLGVPDYYIEKDYWVTRALKFLSTSEYASRVIFKGGTSLSKAYKLINRFSEDIDLALLESGLIGAERKRTMKGVEAVMSQGMTEDSNHPMVKKSGDRFRRTVYSFGSTADTGNIGQVKDVVVLEINGLACPEPWWRKEISCLIGEVLADAGSRDLTNQYGLSPFEISVLTIRKTLPEKIIIIGTAFNDENPDTLQSNIRHIYDLCMILRDEENKAYLESEDFQVLMAAVLTNEKALSQDGGKKVLDGSLSSLEIFSSPDIVWAQVQSGFSGSFSDMVFDDDIPGEEEAVNALSLVGERLEQIGC